MEAFGRKNLFVIFSIAVALVIIWGLLLLNSSKDNVNFYVKKQSGDESVLRGLEISGILQDSYSGTAFRIKDGKTVQKFMYYNNSDDYSDNLTFYENNPMHSIHTKNTNYGMELNRIMYTGGKVRVKVILYSRHWVRYKQIDSEISTSRDAGDIDYDNYVRLMEVMNNKLYLVIPTDKSCRGKSGIYEVSQFDNTIGNEVNPKGYRKLADIDLEDGKIQVRGMYAVGDNLCVMLTGEDKMIFRKFDLSQGIFTSSIEVPMSESIKKELENRSGMYIRGGYSKGNILTLLFYNDVYIISLSDKISLITNFGINVPGRDLQRYAIYKNDMLYLITEDAEFKKPEDQRIIVKEPEYYLKLYVFDKNGVYKFTGMVESDINQDNIWQLKYSKFTELESSPFIHRRYEQIKLD